MARNVITDVGARSALHLAASYGYFEIVTVLLKSTDDVNIEDDLFQWTPLTYATKSSHWTVVDLILQNGGDVHDITKVVDDVNEQNWEKGGTLLHVSAGYGCVKLVEELIDKLGAHTSSTDENLQIPLHWAAEKNKVEVVKFLKEKWGGINCVDNRERTPLYLAIFTGCVEVVAELGGGDEEMLSAAAEFGNYDLVRDLVLNKKTLINSMVYGLTPLHHASSSGNLNIVKLLVEQGAELNKLSTDISWKEYTPVHSACHFGKLEVVKFLIENGADINIPNDDGFTTLHTACKFSPRFTTPDLVKYLVNDCKISVNVQDKKGTSPLHSAAFDGVAEVVDYLINYCQVDINIPDWFGATPILSCSLTNQPECIKLLFDKGAKLNLEIGVLGKLNLSPLHAAVSYDALDIVKMFVESGKANINAGIDVSMVPLHFAALFNSKKVIDYLVEKGAQTDVTINFSKIKTILNSIDTSQAHSMDNLVPTYLAHMSMLKMTLVHIANYICPCTPSNLSIVLGHNNETLIKNAVSTIQNRWVLNWLAKPIVKLFFQNHINGLNDLIRSIHGENVRANVKHGHMYRMGWTRNSFA